MKKAKSNVIVKKSQVLNLLSHKNYPINFSQKKVYNNEDIRPKCKFQR